MTALKGLALAAALIVGTTSLAMAQAQGSGGPDGQAFDGAADNPSAPGSGSSDTSTRAARHHGTKSPEKHAKSRTSYPGTNHKAVVPILSR